MRAIAAALVVIAASAAPAGAERLVSTLSNQSIQITSSFAGETLSVFGNIEPDRAAGQNDTVGPYHVVIVIEGPLSARVARQKTNHAGIWINTEQVLFDNFPSFFHVLASDKLNDISDIITLTLENIMPDSLAGQSAEAGWYQSAVFGRELVRLMTERGLFAVDEQGVQFLSETAYSARLTLPSDVPNGAYIARTYAFKDGLIIARKSEGFTVRQSGFERFLGLAAVQQPFLYGLACVALALGTGWLGGVVFRR